MTSRAQSESIGVILLTAVVVITVSTAGVVVLADIGAEETTRADLAVDITDDHVAVTHNGGESVPFDALVVVVRQGNDTWRPAANASALTRGDTDAQFEPGERWVWNRSLETTRVATVRVFDRRTNTLLVEKRGYPTAATDRPSMAPGSRPAFRQPT